MAKKDKKQSNRRENLQNKYAEKLNDNEVWGLNADEFEEDEGLEDHEKGVKLFDFDVHGRKKRPEGYAAGFGTEVASTTETTSTSGTETSTTETDTSSEESYEFDDEDFAELQRLRRSNRPDAPRDPMDRLRMWESSFFINSFMNLENKEQYFFYTITFGHVNKSRRIRGSLRRRSLYTPGYYLRPGEFRPLAAPLVIWPFKVFLLPYNQLKSFCVTIEMWKINELSFNTLHASARLTLQEIVDSEHEFQILLKRKIAGKKRSYEVHKMRATLMLNEVFDIDLSLDSWWFLPDKAMPKKIRDVPKQLLFNAPVRGRSGLRNTRKTTVSKSNYWLDAGFFRYRGTLQSISNNYITATLLYTRPKEWYRPPAHLGLCIMALKSVLQYPLFRGIVKKLTTDPRKFQQGELIGNIRCFIRSVGVHEYEEIANRPAQPLAGAALVTQLNLKEQYLVVRLFKCENLPAANADAYTSDPIVKIKWDAMVNISSKRENTLRPVYNQNFYFPVRLLDPRERSDKRLRETALPLDLYTKGPVIFEVWDNDELTSDFLGGGEVHLNSVWKEGSWELRCLAEGMGQEDDKTRLPDGRPAEFATKRLDDQEDEHDDDDEDLDEPVVSSDVRGATVPYEWPYETLTLRKILELKGSTLPPTPQGKSSLWFEMFFIPPMPGDVELPDPPQVKSNNDVWNQVTKRWNSDFHKWQKMYLEWFPEALGDRRFLSTAEHMQTRGVFPLPSFVAPIAVPSQISAEGELLHWIQNITFLSPPKQMRDGRIARWQVPSTILVTRKGGVNDHAVLLCSCLLGLDYDAYVCKGTINEGRDEHVWVMTRHAGGWVMMWEATTKKRYNLPYRWGFPPQGPPQGIVALENQRLQEEAERYWEGLFLQEWFQWSMQQGEAAAQAELAANANAVPDVELYGDELVADEVIDPDLVIGEEGAGAESIAANRTRAVQKRVDKDKMKKVLQSQIEVLPISPIKTLLDPSKTLSYLPYSSIEVVFNNFQLWGNLQNHHPACITYDMEDEWKWRPLLMEPADPIDSDVLLAPPIRDKKCQLLSEDLASSVLEHIRLHRMRKGLEVFFEHREEMLMRLTFYLDLLEYRMHLDDLHSPGPGPNHMGWSSFKDEDENAETLQATDCQFYQSLSQPGALTSDEKARPETQDALRMYTEYGGDAHGMFADAPPPGGFFDPFDQPGATPGTEVQGSGGWVQQLVPHQKPPEPGLAMNPVEGFQQEVRYQEKMAKMEQKKEEQLVKDYQKHAGQGKGAGLAPTGLEFSSYQAHMAAFPSSQCSSSTSSDIEEEPAEQQGFFLHSTSSHAIGSEDRQQLASSPCREHADVKPVSVEERAAGTPSLPSANVALLPRDVPEPQCPSSRSPGHMCPPPTVGEKELGAQDALVCSHSRRCSRTTSSRLEACQDEATVFRSAVGRDRTADSGAKHNLSERDSGTPDSTTGVGLHAGKPYQARTKASCFQTSSARQGACPPTRRNLLRRLSDRLREAIEESETLLARHTSYASQSGATDGVPAGARSDFFEDKQNRFNRSASAGLPEAQLQKDGDDADTSGRASTSHSTDVGSHVADSRDGAAPNRSATTFASLLRRIAHQARALEAQVQQQLRGGLKSAGGRQEVRRSRKGLRPTQLSAGTGKGQLNGVASSGKLCAAVGGQEDTDHGPNIDRERGRGDGVAVESHSERAHTPAVQGGSREGRGQDKSMKKMKKKELERQLRYKEEMRQRVYARLEALAGERAARARAEAREEGLRLLVEAEKRGRGQLSATTPGSLLFSGGESQAKAESATIVRPLELQTCSAVVRETGSKKQREVPEKPEAERRTDDGTSDTAYTSPSDVSEAYVSLWSGSGSEEDGWATSPFAASAAGTQTSDASDRVPALTEKNLSRVGNSFRAEVVEGQRSLVEGSKSMMESPQWLPKNEVTTVNSRSLSSSGEPASSGEGETSEKPVHGSFKCVTGRARLLELSSHGLKKRNKNLCEEKGDKKTSLSSSPLHDQRPGDEENQREDVTCGTPCTLENMRTTEQANVSVPDGKRGAPDKVVLRIDEPTGQSVERRENEVDDAQSSVTSRGSSVSSEDEKDTLSGSLPPSDFEEEPYGLQEGFSWGRFNGGDSSAPEEDTVEDGREFIWDAATQKAAGCSSEPWHVYVPRTLSISPEFGKAQRRRRKEEKLCVTRKARTHNGDKKGRRRRLLQEDGRRWRRKERQESDDPVACQEDDKETSGIAAGEAMGQQLPLAELYKLLGRNQLPRSHRGSSSPSSNRVLNGATVRVRKKNVFSSFPASFDSSSGHSFREQPGNNEGRRATADETLHHTAYGIVPQAREGSARAVDQRRGFRTSDDFPGGQRRRSRTGSGCGLLASPGTTSARMRARYKQCREKARRSQCSMLFHTTGRDDAHAPAPSHVAGLRHESEQNDRVTFSAADRSHTETAGGRTEASKGGQRLFAQTAEHLMMYQMDYDNMPQKQINMGWDSNQRPPPPTVAELNRAAPEGMRWDPLAQTYQYDYCNPFSDEGYGNRAAGAIQQKGELARVELNAGRQADYHIGKGAYRVNEKTGAHDYIDGPQKDLYGMYGAMDHIDKKRDKRPKGSRPEGWDVNYAKEKYERGVPAGFIAEPAQEEDQTEENLLAGMLKAPTRESPEYLAFDGGVDIGALGLAPEKSAGKRAKVARVGHREGGEGEPDLEGLAAEENGYHVEERALVASGAGDVGGQLGAFRAGPPTEWHRPSPTGGYAADQMAKWKWYYRMVSRASSLGDVVKGVHALEGRFIRRVYR
ncbi:c2 domain-containing [Cystoisospora suis]|uniref:C2 domain-containing n=1 Tax=Cystoisospora suis TaxID=483139 RepID=A0A2C6LGQ0_9APIC|nr:c2 domain-containing [Cystoisospora suis]